MDDERARPLVLAALLLSRRKQYPAAEVGVIGFGATRSRPAYGCRNSPSH
jgi:hypothetical protein